MLTYTDALNYLDSFVNYERLGLSHAKKEFGLAKIRKFLEDIGSPERCYVSVHVAGTKGKGSVATYVSSIIRAAGHSVGLFTSPHLITPRERIAVDGEMIPEDDLAAVVSDMKELIEGHPSPGEWTYFELFTVAAMMYFKKRGVEYAVFEVGVGGRLDATNVIEPKVAAITPVSYDHMNVLGTSLDRIAAEKAAIIKEGSVCVSAEQKPAALKEIKARCSEKNVPLVLVGKDIHSGVISMDEKGSVFNITTRRGVYEKARTLLAGDFQPANAAVAVGVCEELFKGKEPDAATVRRGIAAAYIPGRMEILARKPLVVIDAAHNEVSAERLKYSVERIFKYGKLILIAGFSNDKDIRSMCRVIGGLTDTIILTKAALSRAADPYIVRGYFKGKDVTVTTDVKEALGLALSMARDKDMILATGSFFVIGEVRKLLAGGEEKQGVEPR